MIRTRVGYAGGASDNPAYHSLGGHSEAIQVDFDPTVIGYSELLEVFWKSHHPMSREVSSQYASVVFYHDDQQREAAVRLKRELESAGATIETEIVPYKRFHLAEAYHQKYYLRWEADLWAEVTAVYPELEGQIGSTAVARLNAYVSRYGTLADFERDRDALGLSPDGQELLREKLQR